MAQGSVHTSEIRDSFSTGRFDYQNERQVDISRDLAEILPVAEEEEARKALQSNQVTVSKPESNYTVLYCNRSQYSLFCNCARNWCKFQI